MINKLTFEKVSSSYSTGTAMLPVLEQINLAVGREEFVSVIGPSGSGKSTILKLAAGLLKPQAGQILIDGQALTGNGASIGYMPQADLLLPWLTLIGNAAIPLRATGKTKRQAVDEVINLLPLFGLNGVGHFFPHQLSGGMRQRAALLRTFLIESSLLLLDEPFASLDALTREKMQDWLLKVWTRFKRSVLFVTHSVDEAIFLSDRIYVLSARPGRNAGVQKIDLPRPRNRMIINDPAFARQREKLFAMLQE